MKKVICIYTCERDKDFNNKLIETDWYKRVSTLESCQIYFVYADPSIECEFNLDNKNNILVVNAIEQYHKLCLKTYQMIKTCTQISKFDYLVKLDATLIDDKMKYVTFSKFEKTFEDNNFYKDYNGIFPIKPGEGFSGVKRWAKGYNIPNFDLDKVPYIYDVSFWWKGKCYVLGYNFCEFIVEHGKRFVDDFANYIGGSEDLMIGKLYNDYCKHKT